MPSLKKLASPFVTGGGGYQYEAHVQASFVLFMLLKFYSPCLPLWPIVEIKLQGKNKGYETDDFIVIVENPETNERRKLLGQSKNSFAISYKNKPFVDFINSAWNDFNNPTVFERGKDRVVLFAKNINTADEKFINWIASQVDHTKDSDDFFSNFGISEFSPSGSDGKISIIRNLILDANNGGAITDDEFYEFLKHIRFIRYNLGTDAGIDLTFMHSYISTYVTHEPQMVWSRIVETVRNWNQDAGTITLENLPPDLLVLVSGQGANKKALSFEAHRDWATSSYLNILTPLTLIGSWDERNNNDVEIIAELLDIKPDFWMQQVREIFNAPTSPLVYKNGIWSVGQKKEIWEAGGHRIFLQQLEKFGKLAAKVLKQIPSAISGGMHVDFFIVSDENSEYYSPALREGIAEGLAILGSNQDVLTNVTPGAPGGICWRVLNDLFGNGSWMVWASLNQLLPLLSESSPDSFLTLVDNAFKNEPCPFDELFSRNTNSIFSSNYTCGLNWALEALAWNDEYLIRVSLLLAELSEHNLKYHASGNSPFNSLVTIFLPWCPQTNANYDIQLHAIRVLLRDFPATTWNLLLELLPGTHQTSFCTSKPRWRKVPPATDRTEGKSPPGYWNQVAKYSELLVSNASLDVDRIARLIEDLDHLAKPSFDALINLLNSVSINEMTEEKCALLWERLFLFTHKHKSFSDASWALSPEILSRIDATADRLLPANPRHRYRHLFMQGRSQYLIRDMEGEEKLTIERDKAIQLIYEQGGVGDVVRFALSVDSPHEIGFALGSINNRDIDEYMFPNLLNSSNPKIQWLLNRYVLRKMRIYGWDWCDQIDKNTWSAQQIGEFLSFLPFTQECWIHSEHLLKGDEEEYWSRLTPRIYESEGSLEIAIDKLIKYGNLRAAVDCLGQLLYEKREIKPAQALQALMELPDSIESNSPLDEYDIVRLVTYLQNEPTVSIDDLVQIEWKFLKILNDSRESNPLYISKKLADDPEFFCEMIRAVYKSTNQAVINQYREQFSDKSFEKAYQLLHEWKTTPGLDENSVFSQALFLKWLDGVKELASASGHLEAALIHVGHVLFYAPPDPDGLWIHNCLAEVLNARNHEDMRKGFYVETINSRGVYSHDPQAKEELKLAQKYKQKALALEEAGYTRFAKVLRDLQNTYELDAKRMIQAHGVETPS